MFEIRKVFKRSEEDIFNDGCQPNSGIAHTFDLWVQGSTVDNLIQNINNELWCEYVTVAPCDETDRMDFTRMEDHNGDRADELDIERWKKGEMRLWYSVYTVYVDEVERKDAQLEEREMELT